MDDYRSPADYARNSGDCPPADEQAQFWAEVEAIKIAGYLTHNQTTTK
jgi:hypothetical protein